MEINCPTCKKALLEDKMIWRCLNRKCTQFKKRQFGLIIEEE